MRFIDPDGRSSDHVPNGCGVTRDCVRDKNGHWHWGPTIRKLIQQLRGLYSKWKKSTPHFVVLYGKTFPNGYATVYPYQLVGPSGKPITSNGYLVKEILHIRWKGVHKGITLQTCQDHFCKMYSGVAYDSIGPKYKPTDSNHYTMTVFQTFIIKYQGKTMPLPNLFKHVVKVKGGSVLEETTTDLTP